MCKESHSLGQYVGAIQRQPLRFSVSILQLLILHWTLLSAPYPKWLYIVRWQTYWLVGVLCGESHLWMLRLEVFQTSSHREADQSCTRLLLLLSDNECIHTREKSVMVTSKIIKAYLLVTWWWQSYISKLILALNIYWWLGLCFHMKKKINNYSSSFDAYSLIKILDLSQWNYNDPIVQ